MVEVRINIPNNLTVFDCPECGAQDVVHIRQNRQCYSCSREHEFDIPFLKGSKIHRLDYHFQGRKNVQA